MATRSEATNFIRHLLGIREIFLKDDRLSPLHISLYYALFFEWNENRFQNPFFIDRSEMMKASKIGSANTYTKCLKELDSFGFIQYLPSFNPIKGSRVNLYTFDNGTNKGCNKGADKSAVQVVIPFNKHIKHNKELKLKKGVGDDVLQNVDQPHKENNKSVFLSPSLDQVKTLFLENEKSILEAEKFYNHFESNGWMVGGKSKMKNWQAAARNWIARSEEFNSDRFLSSSKDRLNVNQNKDYSVPL